MDGLLRTYDQPEEYHFSQESIELVRWANSKIKNEKPLDVLDVGAGCGVIGIEWFLMRSYRDDVTLVEKQSVFLKSLTKNCIDLEDSIHLINKNFIECDFKKKFDIVLCNPPYFIKERSRPSDCVIRNNCRQVKQIELSNMFKKIHEVLKDDGSLFFVFRNEEYKWLVDMVQGFDFQKRDLFNNYSFQHWVKKKLL